MSMLNIANLTKLNINDKLLRTISRSITSKDIDMTICDDRIIKKYNYKYRKKNIATDVLSFPIIGDFPNNPLGSILISSDKILEKAKELNHSVDDELALLFIHGLLHLLGYDHELDNGEMREEEETLIKKFNLPKSLIVRMEYY